MPRIRVKHYQTVVVGSLWSARWGVVDTDSWSLLTNQPSLLGKLQDTGKDPN